MQGCGTGFAGDAGKTGANHRGPHGEGHPVKVAGR
jgi:hypothetical protein